MVLFTAGHKFFSLLPHPTGFEAHPASCPVGIRGSFLGAEVAGAGMELTTHLYLA
jgi:hypothetical protein